MSNQTVDVSLQWYAQGIARVDRAAKRILSSHAERWRRHGHDSPILELLTEFVLRDGKRIRATFFALGYEAVSQAGADAQSEAMAEAGAALEILHAYVLIHDDWMDGDDMRRGGPTVHKQLIEAGGDRQGAALAVLTGNLGSAIAQDAFNRLAFSADKLRDGLRLFSEMQIELAMGQEMDLSGKRNSEQIHRYKTAGYTCIYPLAIGAMLGGGDADQIDALRKSGLGLGLAFQLRDDILDTWGMPTETKKTPGSDFRRGRWNGVLQELWSRLDASGREQLEVLRRAAVTDPAAAARILELADRHHVCHALEQEIDRLTSSAVAELHAANLHASAVERIVQIAGWLSRRHR